MIYEELPTVALLFGGQGFEHDVSVEGAKFVFTLIDREKYSPLPVYVSRSGEWLIPKKPFGQELPPLCDFTVRVFLAPCEGGGRGCFVADGKQIGIGSVFPLLHGDHGEDGEIQGALEAAMIPYVGCGVSAGALTVDKAYTKIVAEYLKIPTAKWELLIADGVAFDKEPEIARCEKKLGYPMFVKPARLGSSIGAVAVNNRSELRRAIDDVISLGSLRILVEERIDILRELEFAYLSANGITTVSAPGEIRSDGFYDYEAKYKNSTATVSETAETDGNTKRMMTETVSKLAEYLGIRDLARFDFFEGRDGRIIFNEANTLPGFTSGSLYSRLIAREGIPPKKLVNLLIGESIRRR